MACAKLIKKSSPFRLILSAIKTPSYNFAKCLVRLIESITKNNFTFKNSFEFSKKICEQYFEYFMARLEVKSLFTNIPLGETIKICCDSPYRNQELLSNINKNQFEKLVRVAFYTVSHSPHHFEKFNEYLNTKHANIKLTNKKEVITIFICTNITK